MFAFARLVEGLAVTHLFIGIAFLIGSNGTWWDWREGLSSASAMVRLICTCALGFAIIGFGTFAIASAGWLTPLAAAVMIATLFFGGCAITKRSPFRVQYWTSRAMLIARAFDLPHIAIYAALLVVAFPAVNVTNAGSDALAFHWAYAMDWINAHGLVVDPFLREPFYAHNDLLLVVLVMLFGGSVFAQFPMWAMGLLTALGVCAGVRLAFRESGVWPAVIGTLLAIAVVYSPQYLRWMNSGYLDAALGFFALASVLALQLALRDDGDWRWLAGSAVIAAFLVGSKTSLLPFVAVYAAVFFIAARALKCSRREISVIMVALVVLASPWYVRNLVLAGDIIPPVLNITLHGSDGLHTKFDLSVVARDLQTDRSPSTLLAIPIRVFLQPDTLEFREFGVNALLLWLYVPSIALLALFMFRRNISPAVTLPLVILTTMIIYWFFTSTAVRYALVFFPLLALCLGLAASCLPFSIRRAGPVLALICASMLLITPNTEAHTFYNNYFLNGVVNMPKYYDADEPFLQKFVYQYLEEQYTARTVRALSLPGRVYVVGNPAAYYYRADGIESIGDWIGPAGAYWLYHATATQQAPQFLEGLGVDAVLMDPARVPGGLDVPIERQLRSAGYCRVPIPGSKMILLVNAPAGCAQMRKLLLRQERATNEPAA